MGGTVADECDAVVFPIASSVNRIGHASLRADCGVLRQADFERIERSGSNDSSTMENPRYQGIRQPQLMRLLTIDRLTVLPGSMLLRLTKFDNGIGLITTYMYKLAWKGSAISSMSILRTYRPLGMRTSLVATTATRA